MLPLSKIGLFPRISSPLAFKHLENTDTLYSSSFSTLPSVTIPFTTMSSLENVLSPCLSNDLIQSLWCWGVKDETQLLWAACTNTRQPALHSQEASALSPWRTMHKEEESLARPRIHSRSRVQMAVTRQPHREAEAAQPIHTWLYTLW